MSVSKALVLLSYLACCIAYNIDVKTSHHIVFNGLEENVHFGYSLALNHGSDFFTGTLVFVGAPLGKQKDDDGNLYQCEINTKNCKVLKMEEKAENYEVRKDQWLGATVYSNKNGKVITCAPRYSEKEGSAEVKNYMIGKCIRVDSEIGRFRIYPCAGKVRDQFGFCQAGFSAVIKKNTKTLVIGAVMAKDQRGAAFRQKSVGDKKFESTTSDGQESGFYLGYAVTYGNFYKKTGEEDVAISIPRTQVIKSGGKFTGEYTGKVNIHRADFSLRDTVTPPDVVKDKQQHIYFGASVCGVDVNGDGYDDLIVGAPFYSERGDEGRVYIFLSSKKDGSRSLTFSTNRRKDDPGLRGSNNPGARFGWSIAKAGDLNNDFIDDFIVGAPQDQPDQNRDGIGDGAIYIYYGRRDGKFDDYQQKITAETVKGFYPNFQQFGYAVAGNVDTNNDDYPDIAVGAWQSGRVLLLRTRPVMDLQATLKLSRSKIPVENFTENCANEKDKQCLNVTVCFSYVGKNVSGPHDIKYTVEFDADISSKGHKRVYLPDGSRKVYEKTDTMSLPGKNESECAYLNELVVEGKSILTDSLSRGTTDIVFRLKYELVSRPECETHTLCPVLDKTKEASVSEKATLVLNCSDNRCDYNLKVKISTDQKEIVIGLTKILTTTIELSNHDEVAYNPELTITHDPSLQYERIAVDDKTLRIEKRSVPPENETRSEKFRLQGPLYGNKKVIFTLRYSTTNVKGNKPELFINVMATATSGQEKDESDNNATTSVSVKREVGMEITGVSVPKLVNYPSTAPSLNVRNGDYSAVNISSVGPLVKVTFELTNTGPSDLSNIQLSISYPLKKFKGGTHDYIVYPISIEGEGTESCKKDNVLNPANITVTSRPRTTDRGTFLCTVEELKSDKRFTVDFEFRLWVTSLVEYFPKDLIVRIEANAEYVDSLENDQEKQKNRALETIDVQVSPQNPPGKSKSTPVWVIIVAVLGGVLLLAIAILALFKLGFFKRNRPPKDISAPQSDEPPPMT